MKKPSDRQAPERTLETPYVDSHLDGFSKWLDVFRQHVALLGGLETHGMRKIAAPLSRGRCEHMRREMVEIRDVWDRLIRELDEVLGDQKGGTR